MLDRMKESSGRVVGFRFDGKLSENEFTTILVPELERAMNGDQSVRVLFKIEGFRSWRPGEGWDAFREWSGLEKVDRIAVVGGEQGLFVGFAGVDVRYFPESRLRDAWGWLREGLVVLMVPE